MLFPNKRALVMALTLSPLFVSLGVRAQTKEITQELSKASKKGAIIDINWNKDDQVRITYKTKVDKKSDDVIYEDYVFGSDLSYKGIEPSAVPKTVKPNEKMASVVAYVGGTNSFNVMSMNLTLRRAEYERNWNMEKQRYEWGKQLSSEVVKPKNNDAKYKGYAAYDNDDDGSVLVLAEYDDKKSDNSQFVFLHVSNDLDLKETPLPLKGKYALVYSGRLENGNVFGVLAPGKGNTPLNRYVYVEVNPGGGMVHHKSFDAPVSAMLILDYKEVDGALYFAAASDDKSNKAFDELFTDYAPIQNPGYSGAANAQMFKYEKSVYGKSFDFFHLLRLKNGELQMAGTNSIKEFKNKVVTPPGQKKGNAFDGRKINIQQIYSAPNGDILVAGQLMDRKITQNTYDYLYGDYVCFQFDAQAKLKAQYAVDKLVDGSKDQLFKCVQRFIQPAGSNAVYWEIMETKSTKYYSSFAAAYNGAASYAGHYLPRMVKMDLAGTKIADPVTMGEKGKYLVYHKYPRLVKEDGDQKSIIYVGHDEDYEKIWLGKYTFE